MRRAPGALGVALLLTVGCTSGAPASLALADVEGGGARDACHPSRTRAALDARGCPVLDGPIDGPIDGLVFRPGRAGLGSAARAALEPVAAALLAAPDTIVGVEGHTDNRGGAAANLELSKRRTLAVVGYLVTRGVGAARLRPEAFGESRPVAPNATPEGRAANRRIEIRVLDGGADGRRDAGAA